MRIGYNLSSAVADILDNSITASSKRIEIYAPPGLDEPIISILDDGYGMSADELIHNMRIGCKDPSSERDLNDLGRFGSGMKTASFSQARRLTVISKSSGGKATAAIWDIDKIEETNSWCIEILDDHEICKLPMIQINKDTDQGTQLIWEKLTFIQGDSHSPDSKDELAIHLSGLSEYIALHFHKFMTGHKKCLFFLNKKKIEALDPFLTNSDGYQEGPTETMRCKGGHLVIKTHVLPHFKRMKKSDMERLGGSAGIAENQGLYIYRGGRLINAGGWLGLTRNSQLGALARVEVEVPCSIDQEWSTDVKKSSLQLPPRVKMLLKKFLADPIKRSKKVYAYRGTEDKANQLWKICEDQNEGRITYHFDPSNMELINLLSSCDKKTASRFIKYLKNLSINLPLNHIYQKMSESPKSIDQDAITLEQLERILDNAVELNKHEN